MGRGVELPLRLWCKLPTTQRQWQQQQHRWHTSCRQSNARSAQVRRCAVLADGADVVLLVDGADVVLLVDGASVVLLVDGADVALFSALLSALSLSLQSLMSVQTYGRVYTYAHTFFITHACSVHRYVEAHVRTPFFHSTSLSHNDRVWRLARPHPAF